MNTGPVNKIGFRKEEGLSLDRQWKILVDKSDLLELIADSTSTGQWAEKKDAKINLKALRSSTRGSGELEILVCAHCAESGYVSSDDLLMKPIKVTHNEDHVISIIEAPLVDRDVETVLSLFFRFHKPQYLKEVNEFLESV